jgi:transcriptional regulator with PAS, ATPase and Fis domain
MPKKKITIDDLAVMVQGGFTELRTEMDNKFADLRTGMEKGFSEVHNDLADIRDELTGVKVRRGESGCGKEMLAQYIHRKSPRCILANCGNGRSHRSRWPPCKAGQARGCSAVAPR